MKLLGGTKCSFISPDLNVVTATPVNFRLLLSCLLSARPQSHNAAPTLKLAGITSEIRPFLKYGTEYKKQRD